MADRELATILNSGEIDSVYVGGATSNDKLLTKTELDAGYTNNATHTTLADRVTVNEADIVVLQNNLNDALSVITTSALPTQTLVAGVPEKLEWMTTAVVDSGTAISHTIATDDILINEAGVYKVYGVVTINMPINDIVSIELYVDNLPTGFHTAGIGRGDDATVSFNYSFMTSFAINDDINLYVTSDGVEITLHTASVTVEKTAY